MTFTAEEDQFHLRSRFELVPFVARLLSAGPLRGEGAPLPGGVGHGFTEEAVSALGEIAKRAAWGFLCREIGWSRRRVLKESSECSETIRLWEQGGREPLRFTAATIDLLLTIHAATRGSKRIADFDFPAGPANGDLLIHHLVLRRLQREPALGGMDNAHRFREWTGNPLNSLWLFEDLASEGLPRLLEPDVSCWLPWILPAFSERWSDQLAGCSGPEDLANLAGVLASRLNELIDGIEQQRRLDLLGGLLPFFQSLGKSCEGEEERLRSLVRELPMQGRRVALGHWDALLTIGQRIESLRTASAAVHPLERSASLAVFLEHCEAMDFGRVAATLAASSRRLLPRIGEHPRR